MFVAIVTANLLSIVPCIKKAQSSHSCHVPSYKPDHSWYVCRRIFSLFSVIFVTLLYLCDIVQFPHLTLELTLTTGFLFVWFPLTSLTNIAVISLDQMHATIRPYTALRHRLIKKWVYGVTIAALVWVLPAMFIILILKNRMFNQSPIFSTSSGPSVFSCGSLGHPTTGFCEIAVRRSTYYLEISIARKKLKIHAMDECIIHLSFSKFSVY